MNHGNKTLTKLLVKDLAKKVICDGHLYLSSGERRFDVMKPGVLVDPDFVKKHAATNQSFDFDCSVSSIHREKFRLQFKELHYLQFEKDLREKCVMVMRDFHRVFSADSHFLSFAVACHEEFCLIPIEQQIRMHETDMHLYRKALYAAAFAIVTAMANDFFHYTMLRDFYNITFSLDAGLSEANYSYFVAEACNAENKGPGEGRRYLESEGASLLERDVFLLHPTRSYELLKSLNVLSYPELAEAVLYQHELSDGSGFPRGIRKGQVSSWEAVIIFADSLVEILPEYDFETHVVEYLLNFKNQKQEELPVNRVFRKLCLTLDYLKSLKETGS
jgi:hypothetical protein